MKKVLCIILLSTSFLSLSSYASVKILSPQPYAFIHDQEILVQIKGCKKTPELSLSFNSQPVYQGKLEKLPYKNNWSRFVKLPKGESDKLQLQQLDFVITCHKKIHKERIELIDIPLQAYAYDYIGHNVANQMMHKKAANKMAWDWGPAIFLYGMLKFAKTLPVYQAWAYVKFATAYHHHYAQKGTPKINWADKVAPALSGHELLASWNIPVATSHLDKAMDFLHTEKRNELGSLDHFGTKTFMAKFYPSSIWVDSLMMWGLLTVLHGEHRNDQDLALWGHEQPELFYETLLEEKSGMLYHAWNIKNDRPMPRHNLPWLRGNGWVMAAMAVLLDESDVPQSGKLSQYFVALAQSALKFQMANGLFDTLVSLPGEGYEETSGSALIAFAFIKGHQLGLLGDEFLTAGKKTFSALVSGLKIAKHGHSLDNVSWLTMPYGKTLYKFLPRNKDVNYGVGSFLLLVSAMNQLPVGHEK